MKTRKPLSTVQHLQITRLTFTSDLQFGLDLTFNNQLVETLSLSEWLKEADPHFGATRVRESFRQVCISPDRARRHRPRRHSFMKV